MGPLSGIRVLELGRVIAAPFASRVLGELGADVIKVEQPGEGDLLRSGDPIGNDLTFGYWNYGKRSISINLKDERGIAILRDLAIKSDVLIDNFRPGTLDRLGLSNIALHDVNPGLIICAISGFGATSPEANRPLHAPIAHAISGVMTMVGNEGSPPLQPAASIADPIAGVHAALAISSALVERARTGKGTVIDLAIMDALIWMLGPLAERQSHGVDLGWNARLGTRNPGTVPVGQFPGPNGWLMVAGGIDDSNWRRLAPIIGRTEDAERRHPWRHEHQTEIYDTIEAWVASLPSVEEGERILREAGVITAVVNTPKQMTQLPYLHERGTISDVVHPRIGQMAVTNSPFHMGGSRPEWLGPAPGLGEHNAVVLQEILGYTGKQVSDLERDGVLFRAA